MSSINPDKPTIEKAVQAFFKTDPLQSFLKQLQSLLPSDSDLLIAGGAIRNVIIQMIHGRFPKTQDIDIFIRCTDTVIFLGYSRHFFMLHSRNGLVSKEIKGLSPSMNLISHYLNLKKRSQGKISYHMTSHRPYPEFVPHSGKGG